MTKTIRIIGIDPGLRRTGFGVVEVRGSRLRYITSGIVRVPMGELPGRLRAILDGLGQVIAAHAPQQEAAVEETFVNENAKATLKLGQARGIAMLAPAMKGLKVAEYTPNLIKKTVVGAGRAEKAQIRLMIRVLMPKADPQTDDAADALAIAICHAHHRSSVDILSRVVGGTS